MSGEIDFCKLYLAKILSLPDTRTVRLSFPECWIKLWLVYKERGRFQCYQYCFSSNFNNAWFECEIICHSLHINKKRLFVSGTCIKACNRNTTNKKKIKVEAPYKFQGFFLSLSKWVTRLIGHTMLGGWAAITKTNKRKMLKSTRIDQYPLSTEGN